MGDWDIRDSDDMDALRADLLACPAEIRGDIFANFVRDPMVLLGSKLGRCLAAVTGGLLPQGSMSAQAWREIVENIVPVDGRHPHAGVLERFLEAAKLGGWVDPRADLGSAMSP